MTGSERVLSAIHRQEPDRVPIDCGAMRSTGIQAIAYNSLKAYLSIEGGHTRVYDMVQQLAEPEDDYLERFNIDAINAGRDFAPPGEWKEWTLPDGSPCKVPAYVKLEREGRDWLARSDDGHSVGRMAESATYFSQTCYPLDCTDWRSRLDDLPGLMARVIWAACPEPMYAGGLSDANIGRISAHVRRLRERDDRAVMIAFGANLFEWGSYLRRMDNFLMDLAAAPADAEALLDKLVEVHLTDADRLLPVLGGNVDLIQLGDDLGMESGLLFSPKMYRRFFKPRLKTIVGHVRKLNPNLSVFLHSCGSIYPLIGDLIEVGIDVINPVQISAKNMEPARLKREFGNDITFWGGGCDTQAVLPRATPQQVRDHVRRNSDTFAPGGGFVFCQVHNLLAEVPPENIVAMYEAAME
ncbi:MAG: uroporphyrinogen decarboxylase family protein [Phycisphaerae bacterium]